MYTKSEIEKLYELFTSSKYKVNGIVSKREIMFEVIKDKWLCLYPQTIYKFFRNRELFLKSVKTYRVTNTNFEFETNEECRYFKKGMEKIADIIFKEPLEDMPLYIGTKFENFAWWRLKIGR